MASQWRVVQIAVLEVCKAEEEVISDFELMMLINDDDEHPKIIGAAVLACGVRRLRESTDQCEKLLASDHTVVRMNAAVALLNMRPSREIKQEIKEVVTKELDLSSAVVDRRTTLKALSNALYEKPRVETDNMNVAVGLANKGPSAAPASALLGRSVSRKAERAAAV